MYRSPAVPFDHLARCAAVSARHPDSAIAGITAGRLWGLRRMPSDPRIHIISPPASQHSIETWIVQYRTAAIHADDVVERPDGIRLTSLARTALDLCRTLRSGDALSVIEQVMADGRLTEADMYAVAVDWRSTQRPFVDRFLHLVARRLGGGAADSHAEVRLRDALARRGIGGLERQYSIDLPGYGAARFDLAVPRMRWAIEVDLFPTHRETAGRESDERRDAGAAEIGWSVTRLGPDDLTVDFATTVDRLVADFHTLRQAMRLPGRSTPELSSPGDPDAGR